LEKPDPYGDWVLFQANGGEGESSGPPDGELISAAREAWPRVLAHAKREFSAGRLGSDSASFAAQVWERVLRSLGLEQENSFEPAAPRMTVLAGASGFLFGVELVSGDAKGVVVFERHTLFLAPSRMFSL
jgi:hypothetical protein